MKTNQELIKTTTEFVQKTLKDAEGGHDWWHIQRVLNLSKTIAKKEKTPGNTLIIELGALLHDIADSKFHKGDETIGPKKAREFLQSQNTPEETIIHIEKIIQNISFKGGNHEQKFKSPELDIIQDADRLDAMGAIGIARTFNYGGHKNREIYNPNIPPNPNQTKEQYKKSTAPSLNHFQEKLLKLKERMNTKTGKEIATHRHKYMQDYLKEFQKEWNGEK